MTFAALPESYPVCSSAGRAGRLVIGRSLVQIPAPGRAELHVEVSLSETLNPTLLTSDELATYPGSTLPSPWDKAGIGSSSNTPQQWHDMTVCLKADQAVELLFKLLMSPMENINHMSILDCKTISSSTDMLVQEWKCISVKQHVAGEESVEHILTHSLDLSSVKTDRK